MFQISFYFPRRGTRGRGRRGTEEEHCGTRLSLAKLGHLKQQIDIEREAELIIFDLEDDTVMSYCMYIVRQLNLTYPPTNWTEAKDLFSKINERSL